MKSLFLDHQGCDWSNRRGGQREGGIEKIGELKPDIIFLDIQMPDLTGFEVIEQLDRKPNIIFTTAYEQYAMKAFETFLLITCWNQ